MSGAHKKTDFPVPILEWGIFCFTKPAKKEEEKYIFVTGGVVSVLKDLERAENETDSTYQPISRLKC